MGIKESGEDTPFEEQEQEDVVDSGDEKITEEVNGDENADSSQSGDEESGALEPIAYWNFDEGAGTSVNDYTGTVLSAKLSSNIIEVVSLSQRKSCHSAPGESRD